MLAGIVAMQVEVLKLGASMGRSLELNSALSTRNASLRESVASLGDDQRIEQLAARMGMVMPPPQAVGFLPVSRGGDPSRAAANIHQPDSGGFLSLASSNGAVVTATSLAAWNQSGATSTTPAASTSSSAAPTSSSTLPTSSSTLPSASSSATATATSTATAATAVPPASTSDTGAAGGGATSSSATPSTPGAPTGDPTSAQGGSQAPALAPAPGPSTGAAAVAPTTTGPTGG
jgi:hypothetical protein